MACQLQHNTLEAVCLSAQLMWHMPCMVAAQGATPSAMTIDLAPYGGSTYSNVINAPAAAAPEHAHFVYARCHMH
jgi:hypothetical protein